MTDDEGKLRSEAEADLEREIRQGRKFNPQEAMARLAGPGAMSGASPVSPQQQAEVEIGNWLRSNIPDTDGALHAVLHRQIKGSRLLMENPDEPLVALTKICQRLLDSDELLRELVREIDVEWGQRMHERPRFERPGSLPSPDDPYTLESVRQMLVDAVELIATSDSGGGR